MTDFEHVAYAVADRVATSAKSSELLFGDAAHHRQLLAQRLGI